MRSRPEADGMMQFALPLISDDFSFAVERSAPFAGQQSDESLREIGYGDAAIAALPSSGVI